MAFYCKEIGFIEYKLVDSSTIQCPIESEEKQAIVIKFITVTNKGNGHGSILMKEFFKANKDIKIFYLDAYFDNRHYKYKQDEKKGISRLIQFYQKHGFKPILPPASSPYENVPMCLLTK